MSIRQFESKHVTLGLVPRPSTLSLRTALSLTLTVLSTFTFADENSLEKISFNRDVRPILSDKCFHCHGPDEATREADLRFDEKESAMNVIESGDADNSELMARILDEDPDVIMPPPKAHKPLEDSEKAILKQWIEQGAEWNEFWAYVPPKWHPVPKLESKTPTDGAPNWIDQMVRSRLQANNMAPADRADKATLVRRVYFDLIGLPPTPEQVTAFMNDDSPTAFANLVDSLLQSKHFGERMAMYWLDLVRYADTVGYHGDQDHNISPYRDWVINAFNENMAFDTFTREQLAGDLLPNPTIHQKIASGYNRLLQTTHEGGLQPREYRAIYAADRVRNVSAVWMGATVGCAQCHDHKYDPYTAEDFYALSAFFADIDDERHFKDGTNALPTRRSPEILILDPANRKELDQVEPKERAARKQRDRLKNELKKLTESNKQNPGSTPDSDIATLKSKLESAGAKYKQLNRKVKEISSRGAWTMITQPLKQPRIVRVFPRGNWLDESGPIVEPAVPKFMGKIKSSGERPNRLDLANWLTDGEQESGKLSARVFANRIWYLYMGVGISKSLDDFGGQGEAPAFPELLDNLAIEFAKDWNVKRLIRQIVTSQTYQQSSQSSEQLRRLDPYNQWFARQSRFRLPAEMIRDNALAVSGLLNVDTIGGKSVKPYQPKKYYRHLNFPPRKYAHSTDEGQWRRGVYVHWQRMFLHPSLKALDAPSREECTCERTRSNTPLAALALLNDPCFVEAARVFAEKIIHHSKQDSITARLSFAYQWAVSREPNQPELELLSQLYESSLKEFESDHQRAQQLVNTGQAPIDADIPVAEYAAWTTVARAILNLDETLSRN